MLSPPAWAADPLMKTANLRQLVWKPVLERVEEFADGEDWLLAIGRPSRLALHLLGATGSRPSCYDAMDDFPEFYSGFARALSQRIEEEIAARVDQILTSSTGLQAKFRRQGHDPELLRNGLEPPPAQPVPMQGSAEGKPVLGYVGTIGDWFDWPLLIEMARSLPEVRFELVGPTMRPLYKRLPSNMHLAGECSADEVLARLQGFSAGLIPFKLNRLTAAVDPVKYYEYRAAGLPVLSTGFGDMGQRGAEDGVHLIAKGMDFRAVLKRVEARPRLSAKGLQRFCVENSWRSRFESSSFFRQWAAMNDG